ncbi:MAG: hypothetical protein ACD_73C00773G0010, partial [uncultured bacterium]
MLNFKRISIAIYSVIFLLLSVLFMSTLTWAAEPVPWICETSP